MLTIVIVNYRSAWLLKNCLRSVFQFNDGESLEIIVVDNDSKDNSKEVILGEFPSVKWIDMGYNAGFARGNNAGIELAKGDLVLLLNPDTLAIDDSITRCYQRLSREDHIAAGIQLLNEDKTQQISGGFFVKGGLNHLLPIPYWGSFIRWLAYLTKTKVPHVNAAKNVEEVDWINGAFLMAKKEAISKAGMLDEDFFLYAEEIEWCSRLKKVGKLCIYGDLQITHLQGEAINKDQSTGDKGYYNLYDKKGLQLIVSNHLRVFKQYGHVWFLFLLLNYTFGMLVFAISSFIYNLVLLKNPFSEWGRVGAFARNVMHLWKLTPTILSKKKHFYKLL